MVQKRRFTLDLETRRFFSRGPSCQVRWQAGQKFFPVQLTKRPQARRMHPGKAISGSPETRLQATLPRASSPSESPTQAVLKLLDRLPNGTLGSLGIQMDMKLVLDFAHFPVGGRLMYFVENWKKLSQDPRIIESVTGCRIDFLSLPMQQRSPNKIADKARIMSNKVQSQGQKRCSQGPRQWKWLHKLHLLSPKDRRLVAPCTKPQSPQPVRGKTPFQDGIAEDSQGADSARRLVGKTRSKRCLSDCPHTPSTPKVPQVSMESIPRHGSSKCYPSASVLPRICSQNS